MYPIIWNKPRGYNIGVIFVILARCEDKVSRYGTIFISIFSRLLWVPITGVLLIVREMEPLSFALLFMVLDPCLALVTLLIWLPEERGPLLRTFCEELLAPGRACGQLKTGGSILIILSCFIIGLIQLIFWYIFVVRPDFSQTLFKLEQFEGFASGYLSTFFYLISIHGLYHVLCALCLNSCLSPGSIFYRVLLDQPVFLILFFLDQIERKLFLALLALMSFLPLFSYCRWSKKDIQRKTTAKSTQWKQPVKLNDTTRPQEAYFNGTLS